MTTTTTDRAGRVGDVAIKAPVVAATTAAITLSGEQTIDGVLTAASRVLVKNQASSIDNGIYLSDTGTWTRTADWDGSYDGANGTLVRVNGGTANSGFWYAAGADPIVVGTSAVTWAQTTTAPITLGDVAIKAPVVAATTAPITLSGEQTIDGVLTAASRVLVKNQAGSIGNGIYLSDTGTWTRTADWDGSYDGANGTLVRVNGGTANSGFWYAVGTDPIVVGTSAVTWAQSISTLARVVAKSSGYTVLAADFMQMFKCSSTFTLSLTAAATLGDGFLCYVKNTGSGVITIDPNASEQIDAATTITLAANEGCIVFCDGSAFFTIARPTTSSASVFVPVRQTVLGGPLDGSGLPNFGGATGSNTVTMSGTLTVTAANGFGSTGAVDVVGQGTNLGWGSLSTNGTMYLYVDIAANGALTVGRGSLAPGYQWGGTYSTTNGQFTFNIQAMIGQVGNGATAEQANRVYVGEVTVAGGVVTAITWYALMGRYESAEQAIPALGGTINLAHNIGVMPRENRCALVCASAEYGYSIGDEVPEADFWVETASRGFATRLRSTAALLIYAAGANTYILNASTGAAVVITPASWRVRYGAARGW